MSRLKGSATLPTRIYSVRLQSISSIALCSTPPEHALRVCKELYEILCACHTGDVCLGSSLYARRTSIRSFPGGSPHDSHSEETHADQLHGQSTGNPRMIRTFLADRTDGRFACYAPSPYVPSPPLHERARSRLCKRAR